MNRTQWTLVSGAGVGAGLMYLLDPQGGGRRRALMRDKATHALNKSGDALRKTSRDLGNRSRGLAANVSRLRSDQPSDLVLADRVRSKMGRHVSHPGAIAVTAEEGRVILRGAVLASEVDHLLAATRSVRGVREVDNRLDVYEEPDSVPDLQGDGARAGRSGLQRRSWSPTARLLAGTAGGTLALAGLARRGPVGTAIGAVGLGLLARGITNLETKRLLGLGAGRRAVEIHKTIRVVAPVEDVFELWANFENFPRFMENVREVQDLGGGRSRWVVSGPAGASVEWEAEVTRFEPERVIAWKSTPGSVVENAGKVCFSPDGKGGTRVDVELAYDPPAGALGHGIATLLGSNPKQQMDEDMVRFKSLIEDGKATAKGETVTRSEVESQFETVPH